MTTERGFTLLELLVTIAVAAIVMAVAVPSFRTIVISNRLSSAANEYVAALTEAKLEAVRRNRETLMCGSSGNPASGSFSGACPVSSPAGTVIALTVANDGSVSPTVVRESPPTFSGITVANVRALRFSGQGLARAPGQSALAANLIADISSSYLPTRNRRCIYMAAGSVISTCAVTHTSTCPTNEPQTCE